MKYYTAFAFCCLFLLLFITACSSKIKDPNQEVAKKINPFQSLTFQSTQEIGTTKGGDSVLMGGWSALWTEPHQKASAESFFVWTITDRGPNGETLKLAGIGQNARPFLLPDFTPRILKLKVDLAQKSIQIEEEILLKDSDGTPMNGLPLWETSIQDDSEKAIDVFGKKLEHSLQGLDSEGLAFDSENNIWIVEEYGPSILKFNPKGELQTRWFPKNSIPKGIWKTLPNPIRKKYRQELPEFLKHRRPNRGFEGVSVFGEFLIAALQSPLKAESRRGIDSIPLLVFHLPTEKVLGVLNYPINSRDADKIGDIYWDGNQLYVIEQNSKTGPDSIHRVFRVSLSDQELKAKQIYRVTLSKVLFLDLVKMGFDQFEKVEGVTKLNDHWLINVDNDFQVNGTTDLSTGKTPFQRDRNNVFGVFPQSQIESK